MEYIRVCLGADKKFLGFEDDCGRSLHIGTEILGSILISKQDLLDLDMITEEIDDLVADRTHELEDKIDELKDERDRSEDLLNEKIDEQDEKIDEQDERIKELEEQLSKKKRKIKNGKI